VLLTDRSCRGEGAVGLRVVTERLERVLLRGRKGLGAVPIRGVLP
jgi:Mg-chelatase subunit ChlI